MKHHFELFRIHEREGLNCKLADSRTERIGNWFESWQGQFSFYTLTTDTNFHNTEKTVVLYKLLHNEDELIVQIH